MFDNVISRFNICNSNSIIMALINLKDIHVYQMSEVTGMLAHLYQKDK